MKLLFILMVFSVPLLVIGGEGLFLAATNREPAVVSCEAFHAEAPSAARVRILGCELDYENAAYREADDEIVEILFPVVAPDAVPGTPVRLVAATRDPDVLALARETLRDAPQRDQEAYLVMMLRVVTALRAAREVDGTLRRWSVQAIGTRRSLGAVRVPVAPGVAVMDLHARPAVVWPGATAGAGVILVVAALVMARRPMRLSTPAPAVSFRGLLLLNLDETAGTREIEEAPALGPKEDVARRLETLVPGLAFDDRGRATLSTSGLQMSVDIGADDLAWAAVVHAEGPRAAAAMKTVIAATRWRFYIPRQGEFLDPRELDPR